MPRSLAAAAVHVVRARPSASAGASSSSEECFRREGPSPLSLQLAIQSNPRQIAVVIIGSPTPIAATTPSAVVNQRQRRRLATKSARKEPEEEADREKQFQGLLSGVDDGEGEG